jgi:hypothetical protein
MKVVTIGRSSGNSVIINDGTISRNHCQIIRDDSGSFSIVDFGSKNGTFVNNRQITGEARLNPNDAVRIGNITLQWQGYFPAGSPVASPQPPVNVVKPHTKKWNFQKIFRIVMTVITAIVSIAGLVFMILRFFR